jgi:Tol biopolymer transport system component
MKSKKAWLISILVLICIGLILTVRFSHIIFTSKISPDASKEECLKAARHNIDNHQPADAIYPLLLAIEKDGHDSEAHFLLAIAYYQTEVYHLAEKECQISLESDPQNREALELLCQIKFEGGKSSWEYPHCGLSDSHQDPAVKEKRRSTLTDFMFVVANSQDKKLIDSIASLTGGRFQITRLTNDLFFDDAPSFSPDGKRVVYHSDTSYFLEDYGLKKIELKKSRIFVMDADGKNRICVSPEGENKPSERFARFSHSGKFIVYEKENSSPHAGDTSFNRDRDIFLKDLHTGEVKRLTENNVYDAVPSFSPDDREIVFISDRTGGGSTLYKLNLQSEITENVSLKETWEEKIGLLRHSRGVILPYCPSFSPDGKSILLHGGWDTKGVFLLDIEGRDFKRLTHGEKDCFFPSFSPDGKRIVFVSGYTDEEDLYIMDADGSNTMRLTYDGGCKRYPTFSPDGKSVIFSAKREGEPDNYFEIYILNLDKSIPKEKLKERLEELEKTSSEEAGIGMVSGK